MIQEALQYGMTLFHQGQVSLEEFALAMALLGQEITQLTEEERAKAEAPKRLDELFREIWQGEHQGVLASTSDSSTTSSTLPEELEKALLRDFERLERLAQVDTLDGAEEKSNTQDGEFSFTDLPDDDDSHPGFKTSTSRRISAMSERVDILRKGYDTGLSRYMEKKGIEVKIHPGMDLDSPPLDAEGVDLFGLGIRIGQGGAGDVYMGIDRDLRRSVAIKFLHEKYWGNTLLLQAFIEEAVITAGLEHPNIVPVYALRYDSTLGLFYVMKRLEGRTLGSILDALNQGDPSVLVHYDLEQLLEIFIEVCQGMKYAHTRGVIHCDLKPNNILVGHFGEVMIVDWGLAIVMGDDSKTQARSHFWSGTPSFMAPEQVFGDASQYDQRTDVWALGVILYGILTLSRPFAGKDKQETLDMVLNQPVMKPSERAPRRKIAEALDAICCKALEKRKEERYASVAELVADLKAHLYGRRRLSQKMDLGQEALAELREFMDDCSITETVVDAMEGKVMEHIHEKSPRVQSLHRELEQVREELFSFYEQAVLRGTRAFEVGAISPELADALGDLYWRLVSRIYPATVRTTKDLQTRTVALLKAISKHAFSSVIAMGRKRSVLEERPSGLPVPDVASLSTTLGHDPWLRVMLTFFESKDELEGSHHGVVLAKRLAFLRHVPLFRSVIGLDLLEIAEAVTVKKFLPRTTIYREDDWGDCLYVVLEGKVSLFHEGRERVIEKGGFFGEKQLVQGGTRNEKAVTLTKLSVYHISVSRFQAIIRENGALGLGVIQTLWGAESGDA